MLLLLILMLGFDLWSPQSNPVSDRTLVVTVQPFAVMDSKVKDNRIFTGGLAVENLTDQPFTFAAIKLAWKDGEALALTQDEIRTSLKAGNWLTNVAAPGTSAMVESGLTSYNVTGQTLPAKFKTNFSVCFLVPKKTASEYELILAETLRVKLKK